MAPEEDVGHNQLQRTNALNEQKEDFHCPGIHFLVNTSLSDSSYMQKEFFSLKTWNCILFQAAPLAYVGKKVFLHLSEVASGAGSFTRSFRLHFLKDLEIFSHFDSSTVIGWLERAHSFIKEPGRWNSSGENTRRFSYCWLSDLQLKQQQQLLEQELEVIDDKVHLTFLEGVDLQGISALEFEIHPGCHVGQISSGVFQ